MKIYATITYSIPNIMITIKIWYTSYKIILLYQSIFSLSKLNFKIFLIYDIKKLYKKIKDYFIYILEKMLRKLIFTNNTLNMKLLYKSSITLTLK